MTDDETPDRTAAAVLRRSTRVVAVQPWMVEQIGLAAVWFSQVLWQMEIENSHTIVRADHEWISSTGMNRAQVVRARAKVTDRGWITCEVRKVAGTPTTHLTLDVDAIAADLRTVHCSESQRPGLFDTARSSTSQMALEGVQDEASAGEQSSFDAFWTAYPRRVGKSAARRAWATATKSTSAAAIMAGLERFATEASGRETKFIPHPASWLNQGRWDDEPGANLSTTGRGPKPTRPGSAAAEIPRTDAPAGRVKL